jgi:hypothetical protein
VRVYCAVRDWPEYKIRFLPDDDNMKFRYNNLAVIPSQVLFTAFRHSHINGALLV